MMHISLEKATLKMYTKVLRRSFTSFKRFFRTILKLSNLQ